MTFAVSTTRERHPSQQKRNGPRPPGPPWYTAARNTLRLTRDPLNFLEEIRQRYGDVVSLSTFLGTFYVVFHPDGVRHVLQENHLNYDKDMPAYRLLSLALGKGLLTNDGQSWLQQRRL